jgi:hypothetical protein
VRDAASCSGALSRTGTAVYGTVRVRPGRTRAKATPGYAGRMTPFLLDEIVERMVSRVRKSAELAIQAAQWSPDPASPAAFGVTFFQVLHRETELVHALLAGASVDEAHLLAERALIYLALKANVARESTEERAALHVVLCELELDLRSWRQAGTEQVPPV